MDKPVLAVDVHQGNEVTDVKVGLKNICFTCSEDETVRIWNMNDFSAPLANKNPHCVIRG